MWGLPRGYYHIFMQRVTGTHILGGCTTAEVEKLCNLPLVQKTIEQDIQNAGLHNLGVVSHQFENGAFTLAIILAESHVSIHTWPEDKYVALDVYLCNYSRDNRAICEQLFDGIVNFFVPMDICKQIIFR